MSYIQVELPSFSSHMRVSPGDGLRHSVHSGGLRADQTVGAGLRFTSFCHAQAIGTDWILLNFIEYY